MLLLLASGSISLSLSLALFYSAMQYIGTGRTGLISSTSVFWGVVGALALLNETMTTNTIVGGLLMVAGLVGFARESAGRSTDITG